MACNSNEDPMSNAVYACRAGSNRDKDHEMAIELSLTGNLPKTIPGLLRRSATEVMMVGSGAKLTHPRPPLATEHVIVNTDAGRVRMRVDEITPAGHYIGPVTQISPSYKNAMDIHGITPKDVVIVPGFEYVEIVATN